MPRIGSNYVNTYQYLISYNASWGIIWLKIKTGVLTGRT